MSKLWLAQIEAMCQEAELPHVDVLVDHAGWGQSVLPALRVIQPPTPWFSLFTGTPEENLLAHAPILMRLRLDQRGQRAWLLELLDVLGATSRLMLLLTPLPFEPLAVTLRGLSRLAWREHTGLLRYFDSKVFPTLLHQVLSAEQQQRFNRVALFWGWMNRDRVPVWHNGTYCPAASRLQPDAPVSFTDEQYGRLGSIGEAQHLMLQAREQLVGLSEEQGFEQCYALVRQAADEQFMGDPFAYLEQTLGGRFARLGGGNDE